MTDQLAFKIPDQISALLEAPIEANGIVIGWMTIAKGSDGRTLGGGTSADRSMAKRIAVAEAIESLELKSGLTESEKVRFRVSDLPTRCGIAVGFDRHLTIQRSIAEAIERWAWPKWIDEGFEVPETTMPSDLSPLARFSMEPFRSIRFFRILIHHEVGILPSPIAFGAVVGLTATGAFPGSRVCLAEESPWEHALIEARRHLRISENLEQRFDLPDFIRERLEFFGSNKDVAVQQICNKPFRQWNHPKMSFLEILDRTNAGYFVVRSYCQGTLPWHLGGPSRFVI